MALRVRNRLPEQDPYAESRTELQWRRDHRALLPDAKGENMWNNRFCQVAAIYYTPEETRPATAEDMAAWQEVRRIRAQELRRSRLEAEQTKAARDAARRISRRQRQHVEVNPDKIVCLDVETTGLIPSVLETPVDEILQLSIIDGNGNTLINEYIRPERATEWPEAERINGISPADVANCQPITAYVDRVNQILADAELIVGYNSDGFDLAFLAAAGITVPDDTPTYDVMLEFAPIYGQWNDYYGDYKWQKLATCAAYYGYKSNSSYHDSLEDARATLHCFYAMQEPAREAAEHD